MKELAKTMTENGIQYRLDETTQTYLPDWENLNEEIPKEKIIDEFSGLSLISEYLCRFDKEENGDPEEMAKLSMVYQLIHDPNFSTPDSFRKVMKRIQDL